MLDDPATSRWRIDLRLRIIEKSIELQVQTRLALVVVSLTVGGSAAIAWATQTVGSYVTFAIMVACGGAVGIQLYRLRGLEHRHREASARAMEEADKLKPPGGEPPHDGTPSEEGP